MQTQSLSTECEADMVEVTDWHNECWGSLVTMCDSRMKVQPVPFFMLIMRLYTSTTYEYTTTQIHKLSRVVTQKGTIS